MEVSEDMEMFEKMGEEERQDVLRKERRECDNETDEGGDGESCRCSGQGGREWDVGVVMGVVRVGDCIKCTANPRLLGLSKSTEESKL